MYRQIRPLFPHHNRHAKIQGDWKRGELGMFLFRYLESPLLAVGGTIVPSKPFGTISKKVWVASWSNASTSGKSRSEVDNRIITTIAEKSTPLFKIFDERQKRLWAATEAIALERGLLHFTENRDFVQWQVSLSLFLGLKTLSRNVRSY